MKRFIAVLALAALGAVGGCATGPGGAGCNTGLCGPSCGDRGGCADGCCPYGGCAQGGCCDACGGGQCGCGGGPGCICDNMAADCPICHCAHNAGVFNRYCGDCNTVGDGPCGPYDYSACGGRNGQGGCGHGGIDCGCNCCSPPPTGGVCQPCCASGDHNYNFAPGPPTAQTAYPYYTVRGPRDFLQGNPAPIGPY